MAHDRNSTVQAVERLTSVMFQQGLMPEPDQIAVGNALIDVIDTPPKDMSDTLAAVQCARLLLQGFAAYEYDENKRASLLGVVQVLAEAVHFMGEDLGEDPEKYNPEANMRWC